MSNFQDLSQKAIKSVIALTSRTFLLNVLNFAGAFALTIFLSPREFGVFIITSTVVDILNYFSDIGLAGALIQKKDELTDKEIYATFTIQMSLVSSVILVALLLTKPIQSFYNLETVGMWLFYALLASFFCSSLKTIPSVLSERKLEFNNIVIPQIVEAVVFNVLIVILAWQGWGLKSYIVAVLARAITGTITIYLMVPWRPKKLVFSISAVRSLLHFGVPYQMNSLIAMFKDRVSLLILGKIIGLEGIGILGWAEKWANLPLRDFLDATIKVSFPLFSRLQDDLPKAKLALERAVYFIVILVFPSLALAFVTIPQIIEVIPKYSKWEPGLTTFYLFLISAAIAAVSTFLTNFLTAIGKVTQVLKLMIMWTILTLTLYPLFAFKFGYTGVAMASVIIGITSVVPYILVRKVVDFDLVGQVLSPFVSAVGLIVVVKLVQPYFSPSIAGLMETVFIGGITYAGILFITNRQHLKSQTLKFMSYAKA
jgi:O-antigen/teichoic acid export membrane protein